MMEEGDSIPKKKRRFRPLKFLRKLFQKRGKKNQRQSLHETPTYDTSPLVDDDPPPSPIRTQQGEKRKDAKQPDVQGFVETPVNDDDDKQDLPSEVRRLSAEPDVPFDEFTTEGIMGDDISDSTKGQGQDISFQAFDPEPMEFFTPKPLQNEYSTDLFEVQQKDDGAVEIGVTTNPQKSPVTISVVRSDFQDMPSTGFVTFEDNQFTTTTTTTTSVTDSDSADAKPKEVSFDAAASDSPPVVVKKTRTFSSRSASTGKNMNPVRRIASFSFGLRKNPEKKAPTTSTDATDIMDDLEKQEQIHRDVRGDDDDDDDEPEEPTPTVNTDDAVVTPADDVDTTPKNVLKSPKDLLMMDSDAVSTIDEGLEVEITESGDGVTIILDNEEQPPTIPEEGERSDSDADTTFDLDEVEDEQLNGLEFVSQEGGVGSGSSEGPTSAPTGSNTTKEVVVTDTAAATQPVDKYTPLDTVKREQVTTKSSLPTPRKYAGRSRESVDAEETLGTLRPHANAESTYPAVAKLEYPEDESVRLQRRPGAGPLQMPDYSSSPTQATPRTREPPNDFMTPPLPIAEDEGDADVETRSPPNESMSQRKKRQSTEKRSKRKTPRSRSSRKSRRRSYEDSDRSTATSAKGFASPESVDSYSSYYSDSSYEEGAQGTFQQIGAEISEMATELRAKGPSVLIEWMDPR